MTKYDPLPAYKNGLRSDWIGTVALVALLTCGYWLYLWRTSESCREFCADVGASGYATGGGWDCTCAGFEP